DAGTQQRPSSVREGHPDPASLLAPHLHDLFRDVCSTVAVEVAIQLAWVLTVLRIILQRSCPASYLECGHYRSTANRSTPERDADEDDQRLQDSHRWHG